MYIKKTDKGMKYFRDGGEVPEEEGKMYLKKRFPKYALGIDDIEGNSISLDVSKLPSQQRYNFSKYDNNDNSTNDIVSPSSFPNPDNQTPISLDMSKTPSQNQYTLSGELSKKNKNNFLSNLKDEQGNLLNVGNYLLNKGDINKLKTNIKPAYLDQPTYTYNDRSGLAKNEADVAATNAAKSVEGTSSQLGNVNKQAIYGQKLKNLNQINNEENIRRDAYNANYNQRNDAVNASNVNTTNQYNQLNTELENQKIGLDVGARNTLLRGIAGNVASQRSYETDKERNRIAELASDRGSELRTKANLYLQGGMDHKLNDDELEELRKNSPNLYDKLKAKYSLAYGGKITPKRMKAYMNR